MHAALAQRLGDLDDQDLVYLLALVHGVPYEPGLPESLVVALLTLPTAEQATTRAELHAILLGNR
jgi:hypothetical protein